MKKQDSEKAYITKRKHMAFATYVFYSLLKFLPIKNNKVVFTAFEGDGGFCCNPRYIAEELLRKKGKYEIIWLVNNMKKKFPDGVHKVKNTFLNRAYHLVTASVWVDNSRKPFGTLKREKQLYIQTWHAAIGFKPIGKLRGKLFPKMAYLVSAYDSKLADYVVTNSDWCIRLYPQLLLYDGRIIKTGSPRCDILINRREEIYQEIREKYGVPLTARIVMFAPTFRGGSQKANRQVFVEESSIDLETLVRALEEKFGGEWYVFLRLHPQLSARLAELPIKNKKAHIVDVSQADDMNELLCAMDALITDYSSSAFDAICAHIPVFLYTDDLEEYIKERGEFLWDLHSLPFSVAETNEEMVKNIRQFNEMEYKKKVEEFQKINGVLEDGHASERVVQMIEKEALRRRC